MPEYLLSPAQVAQASIGRSDILSTPLFGALTALAVRDGSNHQPLLLHDIIGEDGKPIYTATAVKPEILVAADDANLSRLQHGMWNVVNHIEGSHQGTAFRTFTRLHRNLSKLPFTIHGKTGTASIKAMPIYTPWGVNKDANQRKHLDHAWFIGWVEGKKGKAIAFAAVVPESGMGSELAGDLVRRVIQRIANEHPENLGLKNE